MIPMQEIEHVMRVKRSLVHDLGARHDVAPIVVHHRNGLHVATVHASGGPEDDGLRLPLLSLRLGAAGFDSDEIALTADVVRRTVPFDGEGGSHVVEVPKPGELLAEFASDPFTDVEQALVTTTVRRGDDGASSLLVPYAYTDHDGVLDVEFGPVEGPEQAHGLAADALVEAVNQPSDDPARVLWRVIAASVDDDCTVNLVAEMLAEMFDHGVMVVTV